jgi:hypothetical protein
MNARASWLFCAAVGCLLLSLAPSRTAPPETKRNPYAGSYSGTYTFMSQGGDQEGEMSFTVDDDGNVTGETKGNNETNVMKFKGTILKDNKSASVFEYPNGQKSSCFGTIAKTSEGGITGTVTQRMGTNAIGSIEFDVKPKKK